MPEQEQKLHYYIFYIQRFIASTQGWKDDEVGAYLRLLNAQADKGYIPDDPKELCRLITTYRKNWPLLSKKFRPGSEPGQLINDFMAEVREDAVRKIAANQENGKKGGRPKNPNKTQSKPAGSNSVNPTETQTKPIPVTNNQEPVKIVTSEGESVNTRADLSKSNLYREPRVPLLEDVQREFIRHRGTLEMANQFYETHDSTGWFFKGSPIVKFSSLVPGYIRNWKQNEQERQPEGKKSEASVAEQIRQARQKQNHQ